MQCAAENRFAELDLQFLQANFKIFIESDSKHLVICKISKEFNATQLFLRQSMSLY